MAVRQYIGARYVTKIYVNSLDPSSAEWEAGVTYEPLTLVTFSNGSYLSKKEVPGSVGDPASNPDYWVQTGFYNGQIASLQNQINSIPTKRRFIIITDSFGNYPGTDGTSNFMQIAQAFLGINNANWFMNHQSGAGFNNGTFLTLLQALSVTSPDTITDIIFVGGTNDIGHDADAATNIGTTYAYIKSNYPKASMHILYDVYQPTLAGSAYKRSIYTTYQSSCSRWGIKFCDDFTAGMHKASNIGSDGVHPTQAGVVKLGRILGAYITNGKAYYDGDEYNLTIDSNDATIAGYVYFANTPKGAKIWGYNHISFFPVNPIASIPSRGSAIIGKLTDYNINNQTSHDNWFNCTGYVTANGVDTPVDLAFTVTEGKLVVMNCSEAALTNVTRITFYSFTAYFDYQYM